MKELGLGTLALSGKYKKIPQDQLLEEISAIEPDKFSFVDWGYVYHENGHNILSYLSRNNNWRFKKLTLKILRVDPVTINQGIEQIQDSLSFGWKGQIEVMFHNPNIENYDSYKKIISKIKKSFSRDNILFGICINNLNQLNMFANLCDLETIQLPYNLIDKDKFDLILKRSKIYGMTNQVRSLLGGGLFNGINKLDSKMNIDSIRSKWLSSSPITLKRYNKFKKIKKNFYENSYHKDKNDIVSLMYSFIMNVKEVDAIISGGSNSKNINLFSSFFSDNSNKKIYNDFLINYLKT